MKRFIVEGRDMDGITGYYVVDTHHPLYKAFYGSNVNASDYCYGLSMNKKEIIELAKKLNDELEK